MPLDRSTLHRNKLDAFAEFAAPLGWRREPTKGEYEVLRLVHAEHKPIVLYARHGTDHATIPYPDDERERVAHRLYQKFMATRRRERNARKEKA